MNLREEHQDKQQEIPINSCMVSKVKFTPLMINETQLAIWKAFPRIATTPHKSKKISFSSKLNSSQGV